MLLDLMLLDFAEMNEMEGTCSDFGLNWFELVPDDLIWEIFGLLPFSECRSLELVCKRFRGLISNDNFLKQYFLNKNSVNLMKYL